MKTEEWELTGELYGGIGALQDLLNEHAKDWTEGKPALLTDAGIVRVKEWLACLREQRQEWRDEHPEAEIFKRDDDEN